MTTTPVTIQGGIEELEQRVRAGHSDFAIALGGGVAISRKTIRFKTKRWEITNHIDGSKQRLTSAELWTESHIGLALDSLALGDLSGNDGLVHLADGGWVRAEPWLAKVQAEAAPEPQTDPLRYDLAGGPGAIKSPATDDDWEPGDPVLLLEVCEIGPHTVAQMEIAVTSYGFGSDTTSATTSVELDIEDIDNLIATLTAIRQDAIANRGFTQNAEGIWTNGEE